MRRAVAVLLAAALATGAAAQEGPSPSDLLDALLATFLDFPPRDAAQLQADVTRLGGVPFAKPVEVEYLAPDAVPARLTELFDDEFPRAGLERDARVLRAFGLLPDGYDLRQERLDLLLENVVGFYDDRPGRQRLYVVAAEPKLTPSAQMIAVHELRHALQDQHAPTHHAVEATIGGFDDRRLAFMSLLEGDAVVVMELFLRERQQGGRERDVSGLLPATDLPGVPAVVATQLVAPYAAGRPFVFALQKARGWEGVEEAWRRPPRSTEQVLHPDVYLRGEEPVAVPPLAWEPRGALVAEGVLGEMLTRVLLGPAAGAAAGWGGDGYRLWSTAGGDVLLWRTRWDSEADRREFAAAVRSTFASRFERQEPARGCEVYARGERQWAWCRRGSEERLVSAPAAILPEMVRQIAAARGR